MRKLIFKAEFHCKIVVNDSDEIVKEYESDSELIEDILSYKFSNVLPVVKQGGVKLETIDCTNWFLD